MHGNVVAGYFISWQQQLKGPPARGRRLFSDSVCLSTINASRKARALTTTGFVSAINIS